MTPTCPTVLRALPAIHSVRRFLGPGSLSLLFALTACGGDDGNDGMAGEAPPSGVAEQAAAPAPAMRGASSAPLELRISEGDFAGTHQMTGAMSCIAQPGTWMVTANRPGNEGITQVLMTLEGVPVTGGTSSQMGFMAHFGDSGTMSFGSEVAEGSGTATARRDGQGAVIEVNGTTEDGADVSAAIRCESLQVTQ